MAQSNFAVDHEKLEFSYVREFKATKEQVWQAYTNPLLITKWWGPRYLTTTVDIMDLKIDGAWRFVHTDPAGKSYAYSGRYKEIVPPSRLVYSFEYEDMPGHIMTESMTLDDMSDGITQLFNTGRFESLEDLKGLVVFGLESGTEESQDRLEKMLEQQSALVLLNN